MAGLPQYTSNLCANSNCFFAFSEKKRKNTKKEKKTSRNIRPALRMFREIFQKMEKRKENIGLALVNLDENSFKFETGIKNETR